MTDKDRQRLLQKCADAIHGVQRLRDEVDSWPMLDSTGASYYDINRVVVRVQDLATVIRTVVIGQAVDKE